MKTIYLALITAALIAGLSASCEKEDGMMEVLTHYDSVDMGLCTDTIPGSECSDSTHCTCTDPNHCTCSDSTHCNGADTLQNVPNVSGFPNVTGSGNIKTQAIQVAGFTEVELRKIGEVEITSGSTYKVEITDYENLLSYAKVFKEGERLVISYDSVQVMGSKLKISITMPDNLSKVIVSGAGNISVNSGFAADLIQCLVSGAGNISASGINADYVDLVLSGAGTIEAKGTAVDLSLKVNGSGTVKGKELICGNADCDIRGVSTIFLNVTDKLKVNAFVVGSLTYYGSPVIEANTGDLFTLIKG